MFAESDRIINWTELKNKLGINDAVQHWGDSVNFLFGLETGWSWDDITDWIGGYDSLYNGNNYNGNYVYLYLDEDLTDELIIDVSALYSNWKQDSDNKILTPTIENSWFQLIGFARDITSSKLSKVYDLNEQTYKNSCRILWYKAETDSEVLKYSTYDEGTGNNSIPWTNDPNWVTNTFGTKAGITEIPLDIICDGGNTYCPTKYEIKHLLDEPFRKGSKLDDDVLENTLVLLFKNIAMPDMKWLADGAVSGQLSNQFRNFLNGETGSIYGNFYYGAPGLDHFEDGEVYNDLVQKMYCPYFVIISLKDLITHVKCRWVTDEEVRINVINNTQDHYLFNDTKITYPLGDIDFEDYGFHLFDANNQNTFAIFEDGELNTFSALYDLVPVIWDCSTSSGNWKIVYEDEDNPVIPKYCINEGILDSEGNIIDSQKTKVYDGLKYLSNELVRESDIMEIVHENVPEPPSPTVLDKNITLTLQYTVSSLYSDYRYVYTSGPEFGVNGSISGANMSGKTFIVAKDPSTNESINAIIFGDRYQKLWDGGSELGYGTDGQYEPDGMDIGLVSGDDRLDISLKDNKPDIQYSSESLGNNNYRFRVIYTLSWDVTLPENWKISLNQELGSNLVITGGNVDVLYLGIQNESVNPNAADLTLGFPGSSTLNEVSVKNLSELFIYGSTSMPIEERDDSDSTSSEFIPPQIEGGAILSREWIDNGRNNTQPFNRDSGMEGNRPGLYISPAKTSQPKITIKFTKGGIIALDPDGDGPTIRRSAGDVNGYGDVSMVNQNGNTLTSTIVYNNIGNNYSGYNVKDGDVIIFSYNCYLDYVKYFDGGYFWTPSAGKGDNSDKLDLEKKIKYWDPNAKLWVELRTLKWTHDWTYGENEK